MCRTCSLSLCIDLSDAFVLAFRFLQMIIKGNVGLKRKLFQYTGFLIDQVAGDFAASEAYAAIFEDAGLNVSIETKRQNRAILDAIDDKDVAQLQSLLTEHHRLAHHHPGPACRPHPDSFSTQGEHPRSPVYQNLHWDVQF